MLELTGETFNASMLARSQRRDELFDHDGKLVPHTVKFIIFHLAFRPKDKLRNIVPLDSSGIHQAIASYVALPPEDSKATVEFIAACLHLDPSQRPSASDLVNHPWLEGADAIV
jgi:serine/threonine-protein kinase SRPK3